MYIYVCVCVCASLSVCICGEMSQPRTLSSASQRQIVWEISWFSYTLGGLCAKTDEEICLCESARKSETGSMGLEGLRELFSQSWKERVTASQSSQLKERLGQRKVSASQREVSEQWRRLSVKAGTLAREVSQIWISEKWRRWPVNGLRVVKTMTS